VHLFITGLNGFIGSQIAEHILANTPWRLCGIDLSDHRIAHLLGHPRLEFHHGDFTTSQSLVQDQLSLCDVVIPLAAIPTPKSYVTDPLRVFELDFEANLWLIRQCFQHRKRLIFPSTSEVYGMCGDDEFSEESSDFVLGPIHKTRWIYSSSKQLLERLIWSYGREGLEFTIIRPFNWIGPNQDDIHNAEGCSRVITQFIGNLLRGEPLNLVDGGEQKRSFLDISDGIRALMLILENREVSRNQIFNIGNPANECSIKALALLVIEKVKPYLNVQALALDQLVQTTPAKTFYGEGYQDMTRRVPAIHKIHAALEWLPSINLETSVDRIVSFHFSKATPAAN